MLSVSENLRVLLPAAKLADFCKRWGISRLEIFGSAVRDDFGTESDLDFMFTPGSDFHRDRVYGPWLSDRMSDELSELLGRSVDLIERSRIERMENWIKRRHILETAVPVYVE